MELGQRKEPVSCLPHINGKIEELQEANLFQTANTNCSSVQITDPAEKPIKTVSFDCYENISEKKINKRNERKLEEDKTANTNCSSVQITDSAEKTIETVSFEVYDNISDKERNKRKKRKVEEDKELEGYYWRKEEQIKKRKCEKRKNQNIGETTPQIPSTSTVCTEKQASEEEKESPNCIAPLQNDEIKSNDSKDDSILDNVDLNRLFREECKTSQKLHAECRKICKVIKSKSEHIAHVEAAYRKENDEQVIFLVLAEAEIQNQSKWDTEIKIINNYSDESRAVLLFEEKEKIQLTEEDSRKIGKIIDNRSRELMRDHKFLSAISASSVVSKHFGTEKRIIEKSPCIVLTVLVKGIIPLDEEPFPTELDGIPVDVREGGVRLCGQNADEFQTNVKMGCKITSSNCPEKYGTLGGFIEHPEYGLCGITCAHVVINDNDKLLLKGKSTFEGDTVVKIYQPDSKPVEQAIDYELGKLVKITYKEGVNDSTGVDLALFKIEKRAPITAGFPDSQLTSFKTGLVWGKSGIPSGHMSVEKFGCVTGTTQGVILFDNFIMRETPVHSIMKLDDEKVLTTLYKQFHIKSCNVDIDFAKQGDSGALVFMKDNTGGKPDLRCIGMVVAVMNDKTCVVTPITAVLDELRVQQFKQFITNDNMEDKISSKLDTIVKKFDTQFDKIDKRFNQIDKQFRKLNDDKKGLPNASSNNVMNTGETGQKK